MTRVTIIKEVADRKEGETIDVSPGAAAFLVNAGYAEASAAKADQPKRQRRSTPNTDDDTKQASEEVE